VVGIKSKVAEVGVKAFGEGSGVEGLNGASLGGLMNGCAMATAIVEHVRGNDLGNLSTGHVMLLAAATTGRDLSDGSEEWAAVYEALQEHLLLEMSDVRHCEAVLAILSTFLRAPGVVASPAELFAPGPDGQVAPLHGVLSLLFPAGDEVCQGAVAGFLRHLKGLQASDFPALVSRLLSDFEATSPDAVAGSVLEDLLILL
jgi:hypothetical protein